MTTNLDHMNKTFKTDDSLEDRALAITLSKAIDDTGGEYSDQQIEGFIAYYHGIKTWLNEPKEDKGNGMKVWEKINVMKGTQDSKEAILDWMTKKDICPLNVAAAIEGQYDLDFEEFAFEYCRERTETARNTGTQDECWIHWQSTTRGPGCYAAFLDKDYPL